MKTSKLTNEDMKIELSHEDLDIIIDALMLARSRAHDDEDDDKEMDIQDLINQLSAE